MKYKAVADVNLNIGGDSVRLKEGDEIELPVNVGANHLVYLKAVPAEKPVRKARKKKADEVAVEPEE